MVLHPQKAKKRARCLNKRPRTQHPVKTQIIHPDRVDSKYEMKKVPEVTKGKLRQSKLQKNPIVRFGYNEYMAHHYAFMMKVVVDQ